MSHTPGPWRLEEKPAYGKPVVMAENFYIATTYSNPGKDVTCDQLDNARLIAAAPDLLAFAESVVTLFAKEYPQAGLHLDMDKASLLNAAREVIKKARGE